MINNFKNNLLNENLIELIEFYLLDIELGNFHSIKLDK